MLDPVTLLATATAVFNGLKKAVEVGREAEEVFSQLGKWAGAVADLQEWMSSEAEAVLARGTPSNELSRKLLWVPPAEHALPWGSELICAL